MTFQKYVVRTGLHNAFGPHKSALQRKRSTLSGSGKHISPSTNLVGYQSNQIQLSVSLVLILYVVLETN